MAKKISGSVGKGGKNARGDTRVVQDLINSKLSDIPPTPRLVSDGLLGNKTIGAISAFQQRVVKLSSPDGRVDPGGRTITALNGGGTISGTPSYNAPNSPPATPVIHPHPTPQPGIDTGGDLSPVRTETQVSYHNTLETHRRIVNEYSFGVVHELLRRAEMPHGVITSTIRSPEKQASIMYRYAKQNLAQQYELYGDSGDLVLEVYEANRSGAEHEVKALMAAKIREIQGWGGIVSRHCVSNESYRTRNVIDIGIGSTQAVCGGRFNAAAFERAIREMDAEGYIAKFVDESHLVNNCWHLEIVVGAKAL